MTPILTALVLIGSLLLTGCDEFPKDADGTVDRTRAGEPLRVGWSAAEPWVVPQQSPERDGPAGIEPDLLRAWADAAGVRIIWMQGGQSELVKALQAHVVDVVVAGFLHNHPWGATIGTTQPYIDAEIVVGVTAGTSVPRDWSKVEVRYDRDRPQIGAAIRAAGGTPVPVEAGEALGPIAAVYQSELAAFDLIVTDKMLASERHVIATGAAENALTFSLDQFLHAHRSLAVERLARRDPEP